MLSRKTLTYGVFDRDLGFAFYEWNYSEMRRFHLAYDYIWLGYTSVVHVSLLRVQSVRVVTWYRRSILANSVVERDTLDSSMKGCDSA